MAVVAGRMSECHAVISQLVHKMSKFHLRRKIVREEVMNTIDESRFHELVRIYDWTLKSKMGISLHDFFGRKRRGVLNELVVLAAQSLMEAAPFRVELIVAGFMRGQTMFFRAVQKNRLEEETSPGICVIGSGQVPAMDVLNRREQSTYMSLARTMLHVHEAMTAARTEKTVGTAQGYIVMRKRERRILFVPSSLPILEDWRKAYASRSSTATLDDSRLASQHIYLGLKFLHPTKSGVSK
ncbi:MAG TPA: hypothetical protein VHF01_04485 [Candidatus Acidoferrum sp.]|nr:hypothetical protein [Candidatus Acidoferrum sp.]